jgi:hypothetical protein
MKVKSKSKAIKDFSDFKVAETFGKRNLSEVDPVLVRLVANAIRGEKF